MAPLDHAPVWTRSTKKYTTINAGHISKRYEGDRKSWYQEVRYTQGPGAQRTLEKASELRYKDILDAARVFNRLQENLEPA